MAIKKLQNDYTTPEQSKRLLELGLPEWTANYVLRHYIWADDNLDESNWELPCIVWSATELDRFIDDEYDKVLPCWSAGRLMEIYGICMGVEWFFYCKGNFINEAIRRIEGLVKNNLIDFSKFEE